jgi:geranylgeranyl transferase type-2 subunit alpha
MIEHVLLNRRVAVCNASVEGVSVEGSLVPHPDVVAALGAELDLCVQFLLVDERNFHCWNYRRYVVQKLVQVDTDTVTDTAAGAGWNKYFESEMAFSLQKVRENFSNYSAYHHRSVYFAQLSAAAKRDLLPSELQMCETCMYTEPDDQSIYWYYQNLLSVTSALFLPGDAPALVALLQKLLETLVKLVSIEPNSKWAKEGLLMTLEQYQAVAARTEAGTGGEYSQRVGAIKESLLRNLLVCDSNHAQRFAQLLQLK